MTTYSQPSAGGAQTVLFVCPHGAGKSRMAAAFFAAAAPPDWAVTTAGLHPAAAVSPAAVLLLNGAPENTALDREPPRPLDAVPHADLVVSIDCDAVADMPPAAAGARHIRWDLDARVMDEAMRDELRTRALRLAADLRTAQQDSSTGRPH